MIGETRAEVIERIYVTEDAERRELYQEVVALFFECVLGADDDQPLTVADQRAVRAAFQVEIDRLVTEAGFTSAAQMEAAQ